MVSSGRIALGVGELAIVVAAAWFGAAALRARLVPTWSGLVGRIADAVVALALITVIEQALGTFGLLREWIVVVAVAAVGVALRALFRVRAGQIRPAGTRETTAWRRISGGAAVGAVAITVGQWADRIGTVLDGGIVSFDSVHYHLPFAARFAQSGSTAHIQLITPEFPDAYHHANAELLHALGMLFFHRDVLSVFLNLGFVALAVAAAYSVGERWDEGPLAVIALCVVLASPLMGFHHAGTASIDVIVLAFVLSAAALLLEPERGVGGFALVGLAAGMAFGTKLTAVAIVAVLVLAVAFLARQGRRVHAVVAAALCTAVPYAYWLVRDLVDTGNPAPGVKLPFFTSDSFQTLDDVGYSIAHYLTSGDVWRDWFLPGLRIDLGRAWPVVLVATVTGIAIALVSRDAATRIVGAAAGAGVLFYLVMPTTALGPEGHPLLFASNVRYAAPALALGIVSLPSHPAVRKNAVRLIVAMFLVGTLVVAQFARGAVPGWPHEHRALGFVVAGAVVVSAFVALKSWRILAVVTAAVVLIAAYPIARRYDEHRYSGDLVAAWANSVHGARIAIAGFGPQFDLFGRDLSNRVQYVGVRGPHGGFHEHSSCAQWRAALHDGRYDYVVVAPEFPGAATQVVPWTAGDPAAAVVATGGQRTVYRLDPAVPVAPC